MFDQQEVVLHQFIIPQRDIILPVSTYSTLCPLQLLLLGFPLMSLSCTCTRRIRRQHLEHMRTARRRLQSWHRRSARAKFRTKERLWFCELPDSPTSLSKPPSSIERGEDDFDYGALSYQANQHDHWPQTGSSTTTLSLGKRIMVSNRSIMARSLAILWLGTFARLVGPIRVPHLAVTTFIQRDHSQERDGHN